MNKYILTVENNSLVENFHKTVCECLRFGMGSYSLRGRNITFYIYFSHEYNIEKLNDILYGLFAQHKKNSYNLIQIETLNSCGYDTRDNLDWLKSFINA